MFGQTGFHNENIFGVADLFPHPGHPGSLIKAANPGTCPSRSIEDELKYLGSPIIMRYALLYGTRSLSIVRFLWSRARIVKCGTEVKEERHFHMFAAEPKISTEQIRFYVQRSPLPVRPSPIGIRKAVGDDAPST